MPKEKSYSTPTTDEWEDQEQEAEVIEAAWLGKDLVQSPAVNRLLLKNARKPISDITKITGIPEGEVAERLSALLDNPAIQDDLMEEKLILAEMAMQVTEIRERMQRRDLDDEAYASMARVANQSWKNMLEQLNVRRKNVDGKLKLVNEAQGQLIAMAIELAMERAVFTLEKKYPELEASVVRAAFDEALPAAMQHLDSQGTI